MAHLLNTLCDEKNTYKKFIVKIKDAIFSCQKGANLIKYIKLHYILQ